jgi:membrane dipeptidase
MVPAPPIRRLMAPAPHIPVFDGHNDVLLRLMRRSGKNPERAFLDGEAAGHLDLPRMQAGGFAGGLFAIFVPSAEDSRVDDMMAKPSYDISLPPPVPASEAQQVVAHMASLLFRIEAASKGNVKVCRTAAEIRQSMDTGVLAAVMHIEGAEAIDPDFHMLDVLFRAGLRSIGPVWSRPTVFGHGVPFRYPGDPDTGPGLTAQGRALVKACNRLGILLDVSHLNEKGFWDMVRLSDAPIVASHSNAHAICPHTRNLTDKQLAAIRESRGLVGVNYATAFIRADGRRDTETPLEELVRHIDHLIEKLGVDGVGLGSDFDGATIPAGIGDASGLPRLVEAMARHGYDTATLRKICSENWISVLERTWKPSAH